MARPRSSASAYEPWGGQFVLGTDQLGRDMLSRLIYGARNTIGIAARHHPPVLPVGGVARASRRRSCGGWIDQLLSPRRRRADVDPAADLRADAAVDLRLLDPQPDPHHRHPRFDPRLPPGARRRDEHRGAWISSRRRGCAASGCAGSCPREILPNILPPLIAEFGLRFCFVFLSSRRCPSSASASSRRPPTGARWCARTRR